LNERRQVAEAKGAGIEGITKIHRRRAAMKIKTNVRAGGGEIVITKTQDKAS
jgi:hypothetical protein